MNFQDYLKKLKQSENYKNFSVADESAYLAGGFFIIDIENSGKANSQNIDFYSPEKKNMTSFCINENCQKTLIDLIDKEKIPEKIPEELDFDLKDIESLVKKRTEYENIKNSIQKILFSLQKNGGEIFLIGTIFLSKMGLIKFDIDLQSFQIINFEKKSFFDLIKTVKKKNS